MSTSDRSTRTQPVTDYTEHARAAREFAAWLTGDPDWADLLAGLAVGALRCERRPPRGEHAVARWLARKIEEIVSQAYAYAGDERAPAAEGFFRGEERGSSLPPPERSGLFDLASEELDEDDDDDADRPSFA